MGKSKRVKIGYWYYFGIHMGLGRGPIDELVEIRVGDKTAWTGSVTSTTSFGINQPNLFGGEKGEGGIQGTVDVLMGSENQVIGGGLPGMMARMGVALPGFRGVTTLFYDGKVCALNPYPKAWKMRVRRAIKGWEGDEAWYPAKAVISMSGGQIKAMNPAHMLMEAATNSRWGRGLDRGRLNLETYQVAADKLYAEGFGLCMRWVRSGSVTEFIQSIIDTIGAVQDINRRTGLLELRLIRDDYDVASLPHFTYGTGLLRVDDLETSSQDTSVNQVIVKYHDPITDEDMTTPPVDNLGSIQANRGTNSTTKDYPAVPTAELGARLAIRDLQASMGFLRKMTVHLDRRGYVLAPGAPFTLSIPERGIDRVVVRAAKLQDGTIDNAEMTVSCVEDVFGLPSASYVQPQPPGWVPPDTIARDPVTKVMREASWRDCVINLEAGPLQSIANSSAYVAGLAIKPQGLAMGYVLWTGANDAGYDERASGDWVPSATIGTAMPLSGEDTAITVSNFTDFSYFSAGAAVLIDNEEMVIVSSDPATARITLGRGCIDTVPAAHASGSRLWVYTDAQAFDPNEWTASASIYGRFLTFTSTQQLALGAAGAVICNTIGRQARPYPPGNVTVNGSRYWALPDTEGDVVVNWAHRDRKSQDDQLFSHTYGNIGPEAGVAYVAQVLTTGGSVVRTAVGLTGTSWTYTTAMMNADGDMQAFTIELYAVRDGLNSWQRYRIAVKRRPPAGFGVNFGMYFGGTN